MENKEEKGKQKEEQAELAYCEKYREYVKLTDGCKHPKEYCAFREKCLIYLYKKFKDF
ncbi:hypothetical protein [Thermodesulfobacterium hydrogeniphilum]|uniref:hypothetical protein n=1 Tax=Thermodesulfobacterium hydrogeniphilum TaxID=161156 RepID=UPI000A941658|nr:hypothetical protein [Thermodesulfobacterium hydrogeniphilum]